MIPITIGRVVHYTSHGTPVRADGTQAYGSECRAALVTKVACVEHPEGCAGLCVINPTGLFLHDHVPFGADERDGGSWHWPERV